MLTTAVAMTLGSAAVAPAAFAAPEDVVSIDIATINDFHGRIEANGNVAGAAVVAGAVETFRAANPNTIFAGAGDLVGASTFTSYIQNDQPTIDVLNAAGLEVSAAGNHEFDQGWSDLRDRIVPEADWAYLSANVVDGVSGEPVLAPYWVKEVDGVNVGFIGAVTEELYSLVPPTGIADLRVDPIVESVNRVAADLRDGDAANGEADVIVLLVHEGAATVDESSITPDTVLGKIAYGVDPAVNAIVSAHTHLAYSHVIDGRLVVSAGEFGQNLGLMNIQVDTSSMEVLSMTNEIVPLTTKVEADGKTTYEPNFAPVPAVQDIVDAAVANAEVLGSVAVGEISADFNRARQGDGAENRGGESTIGNFVADVHRWATGADIALMNPGGIRANLTYASTGSTDPDGNVSFREAADVQPFANNMMTLKLTGAQLQQVLEEQWQPDGASRPFLKLGVSDNLTYTYDPELPAGERITGVTLGDAPLDPAAEYTVAANAFLAGGGDNFFTLAEGTDLRDTGMSDLQTMIEWFTVNEGAAHPDLAQRAVGAQISAPAGDGYAASEEITISLSSLAFSAGEVQPGDVTVSLNGTVLATAAVDLTVVDGTDEGGRATLTFAAPTGVYGAQSFLIEIAETGTSVKIPALFGAEEGTGSAGGGGADGGADGGGTPAGVGPDGGASDAAGSPAGDPAAPSGNTEGKGSGSIALTGGNSALTIGAVALLLVVAGGVAIALRSRMTRAARSPIEDSAHE